MNNHLISLAPYDKIALFLYALTVLLITLIMRRRKKSDKESASDFFLDGRRLSLPIFVATLVSTWYGGILGVGEFGYTHGLCQWLMLGAPWYLFALIFAFVLVPKIRRGWSLSLVDQCNSTLGPRFGSIVAVCVFLLTNPAPYLWMLVALLELFFPWPPHSLLAGIVLFSAIYLIRGRFATIWSSNTLDFVLMFSGFLIIVPFCYVQYGGLDFLQTSLPNTHLTPVGTLSFSSMVIWWLMGAWTLVDPGFHQRVRAAKTPAVARNGILLSVLAWVVFDFLTMTTALYARATMPDLHVAAHAYPLLGAKTLPAGLYGLFLVSLIATVLSTYNSFSFMAAQSLGNDCLSRFFTTSKERLHAWCMVATLIIASLLVIFIPSAIQIWYLLGATLLPGLLYALSASLGWLPAPLTKYSSMTICAFLIGSMIYQSY